MDISVIVPMFNEQENVEPTLTKLCKALDSSGREWEIIVVDDGSTDGTSERVTGFAGSRSEVRLLSYSPNRGRGRALRVGFREARGNIVCSVDADLSYDESHVLRMIEALDRNADADVVVGSPYMKGGSATGVSFARLWPSRIGNRILGACLGTPMSTVTGILRAYRRPCLASLDLESDGKEIHLEILSKAIAMGYNVVEIPAALRSRVRGKSKANIGRTSLSHLIFSFQEKPIFLFGMIGFALIFLGLVAGGYLIYLWRRAALNPERPLMNLLLLLILTGFQILLFGFLASQIVHLRREFYRIFRRNVEIQGLILDGLTKDATGTPETTEDRPASRQKKSDHARRPED